MTLTIRTLHAGFVAEVLDVDLVRALDDTAFETIVASWRRHSVLVFRRQTISPEAQLAFSRRLGELDPAPAFDVENSALDGFPEIAVVSNIKVNGRPIGGLGDGELAWHSDMTYAAEPPVGCSLLARTLPASGGDTLFLDLRAAWRALPEGLQRAAVGARIFHDRAYTSAGTPRLDAQAGEGSWHPVHIRDPLSGEDSLLLGRRRNSRISPGDGTASDDLLESFWSNADRPEHVYRHVWIPGDMLLWNNLVAMHRRDAFDAVERRLLHRTQIRRLRADLVQTARS